MHELLHALAGDTENCGHVSLGEPIGPQRAHGLTSQRGRLIEGGTPLRIALTSALDRCAHLLWEPIRHTHVHVIVVGPQRRKVACCVGNLPRGTRLAHRDDAAPSPRGEGEVRAGISNVHQPPSR